MTDHYPGCGLDPVHWTRHALVAALRLLSEQPDVHADVMDRTSAVALLNELERVVEFDPDWRTVTLYDVAKAATLMRDDGVARCTCGGQESTAQPM